MRQRELASAGARTFVFYVVKLDERIPKLHHQLYFIPLDVAYTKAGTEGKERTTRKRYHECGI